MLRSGRPARGTVAQWVSVTTPQRTCIGCRGCVDAAELVRTTLVDGVVRVDRAGRAPGRGAWVHADERCVALALKRRAWSRALPGAVIEADELRAELGLAGQPA